MRTPAGYLRRSYAQSEKAKARDETNGNTRKASTEPSREAQEASVRRMAAHEGAGPELYVDWGVSGARVDRREYQRLRKAVIAGRVSTVYAYSLSRLGRNARELLDFLEVCEAAGTKVVTEAEGALAGDTAMGRFLLMVMAAVAELEREMGRERSAASRAVRVERGDHMGPPKYGFRHEVDADTGRIVEVPDDEKRPLQPVIDAYRESGSVQGAVKLLNARAVTGPQGGRWHLSSATRVLARVPGLLPPRGASGKRIGSSMVLSQLLKCHCGHTLTPNAARGQYYCSRAAVIGPSHGRYNVTERRIMPWVKAEAARFVGPDVVDLGTVDTAAERDRVDAERQRLRTQHRAGLITDDELLADVQALKARLDALDDRAYDHVQDLPEAIDWEHDSPEGVNRLLRSLWRSVTLGPDLMPLAADWTVPQWRAAAS